MTNPHSADSPPDRPPVVLIAALTSDHVIGRDGHLPWRLPEEYAQFVEQVRGHAMVMGRRSWLAFGADLPETRFVVVSRTVKTSADLGPSAAGGAVAAIRPDVAAAVDAARALASIVFIGGGTEIYRHAMPPRLPAGRGPAGDRGLFVDRSRCREGGRDLSRQGTGTQHTPRHGTGRGT